MAAEEGFEPSQTESESAVLPLHHSASTHLYSISIIFACQCLVFNYFKKYVIRKIFSFIKYAKILRCNNLQQKNINLKYKKFTRIIKSPNFGGNIR